MRKYNPFERAILKVVKEGADKKTKEFVQQGRYLDALVVSWVSCEIERELG